MSSAKGKAYAALPARAMGDKRLAAEDYRVLMAIAAHDRLGANGVGCYAGHPRLASLAGCHEKSLSRTLAKLKECGYLEIRQHPMNGRLRVYRILYTAFDSDYFSSTKGSNPVTKKSAAREVAELLPEAPWNGSNLPPDAEPKVTTGDENTQENQIVRSDNIFSETEIDSMKWEGHPAEPARLPPGSIADVVPGKSLAPMLGIIERKFQHGINVEEARRHLAWIEHQLERGIVLDADYQRAIRLQRSLTGHSDAA